MSKRELYAEWEKARDELQKFREELGFVWKEVKPGEPIESPPQALTPENAEKLRELQQKVDDLWEAYRQASA